MEFACTCIYLSTVIQAQDVAVPEAPDVPSSVGTDGPVALDAALWPRVVALQARTEALVARELQRRFHLGLSEFRALLACAGSPKGEVRMQELARAVHLDQSSVSRLVRRLEAADLTERRQCEDDRRGVYTGITDHGLHVLRSATPVHDTALTHALEEASRSPDLGAVVRALRSLPPTDDPDRLLGPGSTR